MKTQKAGNLKAMKRSKLAFQATAVGQQRAITDFRRAINQFSGAGETLLHKVTSDESESSKAFDFEICRLTVLHHSVSLAQYAFPEARLVLSGDLVTIMIDPESVPGASLKEKYANIYDMHVADLLELAAKGGGTCNIKPDEEKSLLIIPAGLIIVDFVASEFVEYVRWSFAPSEEGLATVAVLQKMIISSFPECNSLTMQAVHKLCVPS